MFEMCNFAVSKNSRRDEIRNLRKETFAGPKGKSAVTPRLVEPMGGVARYAPSNLGCVFVVLAKFVHASGSSPNELVRFAFFLHARMLVIVALWHPEWSEGASLRVNNTIENHTSSSALYGTQFAYLSVYPWVTSYKILTNTQRRVSVAAEPQSP
jgi:hypothetical protein